MNIYLVSRIGKIYYDQYESMVAAEETEDEVRKIHPSEFVTHYRDDKWYGTYQKGGEYEIENSNWVDANKIDTLEVKFIGIADNKQEKGIILASFNAG